MIYAVTGATGAYGAIAVRKLISLGIPASSVRAIARNEEKAASLKELGVQSRIADYNKPEGLVSALAGVSRLLLVSGSEVGKRAVQHGNVVHAARTAGVERIAYTSITRADTSGSPLAPEHKASEELILASGIPYLFLRNNWYTENYLDQLRAAASSGKIRAAVGRGRVSSASREDFAEAAVRALVSEAENQVYELAGDPWDYEELARLATLILGTEIVFEPSTAEQLKDDLKLAGLPEGTADFVLALDQSIAAGDLDIQSKDLESLLGRKPASLEEGLKAGLAT